MKKGAINIKQGGLGAFHSSLFLSNHKKMELFQQVAYVFWQGFRFITIQI